MAQAVYPIILGGGLDLTTPAMRIHPGRAIGGKNYEPSDEGGYRRLAGYERFDGLPSPSGASYWILDFDDGDGTEVVATDTVTGATSGATGIVLSITTASGTWGVDAVGELRLYNVSGTFEDNEDLEVSATKACVANGAAFERGEPVDATDETYMRAAIEARRSAIGKVPGADDINGAWVYNGVTYAIRDNVGTNSVTSTGIAFTNPATITDSGSGLGIFSVGQRILISGAASPGDVNNTSWTVDTVAAGTMTVSRTDSQSIVTDTAGDSITIAQVDHAEMWNSSAAGWVEVDLGHYLDFSAGSATFTEGATVTGSPSTATGTVVGIGVTSGTWGGSDAAGRLYIAVLSGTFTATDTLADDGTTPAVANCDSAQIAVELPRGGKYEFQNYNFFGNLATLSMWAVNGVGRGFRYNDTTGFTHVHVTGLTDALDMPEHLEAHKKHLFYSIGSSVQHSSLGFPMIWNAITGAAEIATGDTVTALENQPGDILGIFNRNRTYLLYGTDISTWDLVNWSLERGAIEWSVQDLGYSIYHDDRGLHRLDVTDEFGDITSQSLSEIIDPAIQVSKSLFVNSIRIKSLSQYRVYYSNNQGFLCRFDKNKAPEFMPFELDHEVVSICAEEDSTGLEQVFFGSTDGYLYHDQKGESFDGAVIDHNIRYPFADCGSPRQEKRFRKATVQLTCASSTTLSFAVEFSYGATGQPQAVVPSETVFGSGDLWGVAFWGDFIWDGPVIAEAEAYIDGIGHNISLILEGSTNYEKQHTLEGLIYNYSNRKLKR